MTPGKPGYVQHIANMTDASARLHAAAATAVAQSQAVAKASKVKPVKSSSGAVPNGASQGSGLDAVIAKALHGWS